MEFIFLNEMNGIFMYKKGFAKSDFLNLYQAAPWPHSKEVNSCCWPMFDLLLAEKRMTYFDYTLVLQLLKNEKDIGQEAVLFLSHLIGAAKEGHICININDQILLPSVEQIWQNEEGIPLPEITAKELTDLIVKGSKTIPLNIMTRLDSTIEYPPTPICKDNDHYYLQKHWIHETFFLKHLRKHLSGNPTFNMNYEKINQDVKQLLLNGILLDEQAEAIREGCLNPLTLITGGPGTGKTYTASHLIKVFWENLSDEQKQSCQIVLAAPTGKAAANLQRSLGRVASLENFPPIQAKTLHSLLEIRQGASLSDGKRLSADLIVIDESSMIDIRIMTFLFAALKPGSRVVLLGDRHQLPSVEAGSVFVDLIHLHNEQPHLNISCVTLNKCMRAELKSLIEFAQKVNQGLSHEVLEKLNTSKDIGIKRISFSQDHIEGQKKFLQQVLPYFPFAVQSNQKPEEFLPLFNAIRLLSPIRKGLFGVEMLNQMIWKKLCQQVLKNEWMAIPIMILSNDYHQELFNGETGVLFRKSPLQEVGAEDYALFPASQEGGEVRKLSALLLPKYELAYCISVHKSQGSEFDHVVLTLPEGSEIFGREVFYTAITRARKGIEIYGSDEVISNTIKQEGIRLSGIVRRMRHSAFMRGENSLE